jgi:hypothetical protein
MRVLIQDGRSKKYLAGAGEWVDDACAGRNFGSHLLAYEIARQTELPQFNIVLYSPRINHPFAVDNGGN